MKSKTNSPISNKEAVDSVFEESDEYNFYYESVSVIFRVISFALFAILLLFVIGSAFIGAEAFSYSNLEYIARNFALTLKENKDLTQHPIRYNPDPMNQFGLFGEGLAVCGSSALSIYSATGRQTCSEALSFRKPIMISSDKYVLVYDEESGNYTLFNSFSSVYEGALANSIRGASIADNGCYALLTSSDGYGSVVEIYDSDFSLKSRYNKTGYVSCMDISETQALIVTVNMIPTAAEFNIEILASDFDKAENIFSSSVSAGFPLGCSITPSGFTVVCSDSVFFLDKKGDVIANHTYKDNLLSDFVISSTGVLLLFKTQSIDIGYEVVCIDNSGESVYSKSIPETVFDIEMYEDSAFILTETNIIYLKNNYSQEFNVESSDYDCRICAISRDKFYDCSDTYASVFN